MQALDLAEKLFRAIESFDADAIRQCYAEDAVIWHDFDQVNQSAEDNIAMLSNLHALIENACFTTRRRELVEGGFLELYDMAGNVSDGRQFSIPACVIAKVERGRIARIEEYVNPAPLVALLSPEEQVRLLG